MDQNLDLRSAGIVAPVIEFLLALFGADSALSERTHV